MSVRWSVRWSVRPSVRPSVGNAFVSAGRDEPANDLFGVYKLVRAMIQRRIEESNVFGVMIQHCFVATGYRGEAMFLGC